jgi:predicted ribosome quality control (RQC) complex YloA/Tae2 family protein
VSNTLRFDPLLVRELAKELHARYAGQPLRRLLLERDSRTLKLGLGTEALEWDLHPSRGYVRVRSEPLEQGVRLSRRTVITKVHAPPDDRVVIWDVRTESSAGAGRLTRIVVELLTNQWNALALDAGNRVLSVLWRRNAGTRVLAPGAVYEAPGTRARIGKDALIQHEEWHAALAVPAGEHRTALLRAVAYTSPLNADYLLGPPAYDATGVALDAAYDRYVALLSECMPCVLRNEKVTQPYTHALGKVATPTATLLDAFGIAAQQDSTGSSAIVRAEAAVRRAESKLTKLERDLIAAPGEAAALRTRADVLISNLPAVRRGAAHVDVTDFDGNALRLELDPALSPSENAARMYDRARRRERAAAQLPVLIESARQELAGAHALLARLTSGEGTAEDHEIRRAPTARRAEAPPAAPYRTYRSSGGLEIRVGKNSRSNDDLTFRHSRPSDIWLHARDSAGAHVILRWADAQANPPSRDLHEAATLAALHSRSRSSGTVPVDWTRRKHVRKPRKAPPGSVIPERVKTIFVEPDAGLEKRLRTGDAQ